MINYYKVSPFNTKSSPFRKGRDVLYFGRSYILYFFCLFLISCEKDITVDLPQPQSKIVVEGTIESGGMPYLYLTKNAPYFAPVDPDAINQYVVHDAIVTINDGTKTDTLKEFVLAGKKTGYYTTYTMRGIAGKFYRLNIEADGKKLWATTKIPSLVPLDSANFKLDTENDSLGRITAHLSDPDSIGNYYRVMTQRTNRKYQVNNPLGIMGVSNYLPTFNSVYEDRIFNGKNFEIRISRGQLFNSTTEEDNSRARGRFKRGDTISIKWMSISKEAFDFWRTLEVTVNNSGNPFAAPVTIRSNIKGDGLGLWGGYGVSYLMVIAK